MLILTQVEVVDEVGVELGNLWKNQLNSRFSNRRTLAEPLLICDLPGQNINLGNHIRSNNQDGDGLENPDNNNQGSDMSFDVETLRTMPVIDGALNPSESLWNIHSWGS